MSLNELMMALEIGLIYGVISVGIYLSFRIIDFPDLTCDGSVVLGAASSAMLIKLGVDPFISLIGSLFAGALAGIATAILYIKFKMSDLLAGILVGFMLYSLNLRVMGGVPNLSLIGCDIIFVNNELIYLTLIGLVLCALISYLLLTDFGLALRATGENKLLAKNSGVNINYMILICLALSNAIIAFGGGLLSQYQGFADIGSGVGTVIIGFASVMIGEKLMPYRSMILRVLSCLIGSITYRLFISLALHSDALGLSTSDLNLITGILVIIIMYIPRRKLC